MQPGAASCLVLGTESGKLLLLNSAGTAVAHTISLGSPPAFLACAGLADLHHRIAVATRDGRLHIIKNGQPDPQPVHLETPAVGVVSSSRSRSRIWCCAGAGSRSQC
jgi:Bardet-Biedl syndrome 1 protein